MHSHGDTAGSSVDVVAAQRPLPPFIEFAFRVQRQRTGRYGDAALENLLDAWMNCSRHKESWGIWVLGCRRTLTLKLELGTLN
jgi:hypothetical protein